MVQVTRRTRHGGAYRCQPAQDRIGRHGRSVAGRAARGRPAHADAGHRGRGRDVPRRPFGSGRRGGPAAARAQWSCAGAADPDRHWPLRLRAEYPNHVWSYDFVEDRTHDGRKYRMLNLIDEFTHECLAIRLARKLRATDVIDALTDLFILRGVPGHIRSDNGPEFVAKAVQAWITAVGAK